MRILHFFHQLTLISIFLFISACDSSGDNSSNEADTKNAPLTVAPELNTAQLAVATITPAGGIIETTSDNGQTPSLNIPAGTVLQDTEISITPVTDIPNLSFGESILAGVQFAPDGLLFAKPAVLTIDLPADTNTSNLLAIGWDEAGNNTRLELVDFSPTQATFLVSHFSGIALVQMIGNSVAAATGAAQALNGNTNLQAKYVADMTIRSARNYVNICGTDDETTCFGSVKETTSQQIQNLDDFKLAYDELVKEVLTIWLDDLNELAPDAIDSAEKFYTVTKEFFIWTHSSVSLICGELSGIAECEKYPAAEYADRINLIESRIAKGVIASFERTLASYNDLKVLELISQTVLLGPNIKALVLVELEVAADSSMLQELKNRYARQLSLEVTGYPATLSVGDDPVDFSVQLSHRTDTTTTPLSGTTLQIGPNEKGCALLSYSDISEIRDLISITTDSMGQIDGLSVKADSSCEPIDQSIIYFISNDNIFSPSTPYLGREDSRSAVQATLNLKVTNGSWFVGANADHRCTNDDDESCGVSVEKASNDSGTLPPSASRSFSASASTSKGAGSASASGNFQVDISPPNGDLLTLNMSSTISVSGSTSASSNSNIDARTSGRIEFEIADNTINYSASWSTTGFNTNTSQGSAYQSLRAVLEKTGVSIFSNLTLGNETSFNKSGALQPGKYTLIYTCSGGVELSSGKTQPSESYSDSGTCLLDFKLKP